MSDAERSLWIRLPNGQVKGPFPSDKVKAGLRAGRIPEGSAIGTAAGGPWKEVGQVTVQSVPPSQSPLPPNRAARLPVPSPVPAEDPESPSEPDNSMAVAAIAADEASDSEQSALPVPLVKKVALWRILSAFAVAGVSDLIGGIFTLVPPIYIPLDLATGAAIWFALGRPVLLLAVLVLEAIPGVGAVPLWTLVVAMIVFIGKLPGRSGAAAAKGDAATQAFGALTQLAGDMTGTKIVEGSRGKHSR
jgi:hypothetical protein